MSKRTDKSTTQTRVFPDENTGEVAYGYPLRTVLMGFISRKRPKSRKLSRGKTKQGYKKRPKKRKRK